jgi:hypothetical protein
MVLMNHEELHLWRSFVLARRASSFLQRKVTSRKAVEKAETTKGKLPQHLLRKMVRERIFIQLQ